MNTTDTLNESAKAAARYQVELTAKKEAAENSSQIRMSWQQEYERLKSRKTKCTIFGALALLLCVYVYGSVLASTPTAEPWLMPVMIAIIAFSALWTFTIPFGMCPLIDFMHKNGLWVVGGWVIMLVLFFVVIVFAFCAGPFYFFYLNSKIKEAKHNIEIASQNEQTAYAEYQAY